MFSGLKNGYDIIKTSARVFYKHPRTLIPILVAWALYAAIILLYEYEVNWESFTSLQVFFLICGAVFLLALILTLSCLVLLELIEQHETGGKMSLFKAFKDSLGKNFVKALPIVIIWSIIWLLITIVQALFSRSRNKSEDKKISAESAAKTLAGYQKFSFTSAFFDAIQKGVRMFVFLILPAIAWDNLGFINASKKGYVVFKAHLSTFVSGFVLTGLLATLVFLPVGLIFHLSDNFQIEIPDWGWMLTIIYTAFAWSYSIYIEQMFCAELYLWNKQWEREVEMARLENRELPNLEDVQRPSILNEVPELISNS